MTMQAEPVNRVAAYGCGQPRPLYSISDFFADVWRSSLGRLSETRISSGAERTAQRTTSVHDAVLEAQAYVVSHGGFHYR